MPQKDLYTRTLELARSDPRNNDDLAADAGVNRHWLEKFRQGRFANPGVKTVEQLYNCLMKKSHRSKRAEEAHP